MTKPYTWPRLYPKWKELASTIRQLYEAGLSAQEVANSLGLTKRHALIIIRSVSSPREIGKHKPVGLFKKTVGYSGAHQRVYKVKGKADFCVECGRRDTGSRYEWANLTGDYLDINAFVPMCVRCHRIMDDIGNKAWKTRRERCQVL